jgi:ParB/RepB/Spo0J family partition protein
MSKAKETAWSAPTSWVDASKIEVGDNIRDVGDVKELAASIQAVYELSGGHKYLLQPITVRKTKGGMFAIRYGFRRFAALQYLVEKHPEKCNWATAIPILVDDDLYDEKDGAETAYRAIENIQRAEMSILEEAYAVQRLIKESGLNQSEVAKVLAKSKGWVTQRLNTLKTDPTVQSAVQDGVLGQAAVRVITRVPVETQRFIMQDLAASNVVPTVESITQRVDEALTASFEDLGHDEKLKVVKKRAEAREKKEAKEAAKEERHENIAPQIESKGKEALSKNDRTRAAFYAGVEQGLSYAAQERKSIQFPSKLEEQS